MGAGTYDYIVVGAGSTGCVIASRLSEDPDVTVLLVEEGGSGHALAIDRSFVPELFRVWRDPSVTRDYPVHASGGLVAPSILRGVVRGGSGAVNGMIYVRGNRRDYDGWAAMGCDGWSYAEVLPMFRASEDFEGGADPYHGVGGPLRVRRMITPSRAAGAFVRAGIELGHSGVDPDAADGHRRQWDFNGAEQEGVGLYQVTVTRDGRRASAAEAFLDTVIFDRPNLVERTGVLACRVIVQNGAAAGVACLEAGIETVYRALREVVVAGGAFGSPKLLMLSGIGPADALRRLGIAVVADVPGVGENLHDHLLMLQYFALNEREPQPKFIAEAGLFTRSPRALADGPPDLQYHFAAGMHYFTPPQAPAADCVFCPTLAQPKSRGRLTLLSADPRHPPLIDPAYLAEPDDVGVLAHGMALSRELFACRAFDALRRSAAGEATPGLAEAGSDEAYVRAHARTVWHPVGTCRMGPAGDAMAVVDPRLRVRGVERLRVADASVMPRITSGNTNAACLMIGEKAARMIRADAEVAR